MSDALRIVVGLGNPGKKYDGTRHNAGFEVLDRIAAREGAAFERNKKWDAEVAKLPGGVLLVKPQTFMNLSGRAVGAALRFYKLTAADLLVVFDDIALPLGQLRFRMAGGAGGHNGIKSLIEDLGTREFPRLKIGVGGGPGNSLTGHVLGRFREEERQEAENMLARAVDAVQLALSHGAGAAANQYNVWEKEKEDPEGPGPEIREPDHPRHEGE